MLLSSCLVGDSRSDQGQSYLFEDIFEDFGDGTLCALCLRSERNSEALPVLPSKEEYSMLPNNSKGKLPDPLKFVAPHRFVTSSLAQTLTCIDNLLPGTELEVHTTSSPVAAALRPLLKGVRVLTLPYLEFEYCNVYRGTYGKTLPLIHRHPEAIVILWNKGDHDHVFFLMMSQLLPCLKDMQATNWSLIGFWNESKGPVARRGPDVGLDFTDQPAPTPALPPQPPTAGEDVDYPGYDDPQGDMPVDDEDMPPPTSQPPEPDLDDDPVELHTGGDPPSQPPGGGAQVPVPEGDHDDSHLEMPLDSEGHGGAISHQEAVPQGPGPGYGLSRPCLWSIMMSRLLLEVVLVLLERFRSLLIRIKCLVHLCRGRHLLHRLFHHTRNFRCHRV